MQTSSFILSAFFLIISCNCFTFFLFCFLFYVTINKIMFFSFNSYLNFSLSFKSSFKTFLQHSFSLSLSISWCISLFLFFFKLWLGWSVKIWRKDNEKESRSQPNNKKIVFLRKKAFPKQSFSSTVTNLRVKW